MATTPDIDVSAGAEEPVSLEVMLTELHQGGTVILDVSSAIAKNLRQRLHEVHAEAFEENVEDEKSYFSIPAADDRPATERSTVTVSANLERGTWDDLRVAGDSDWVRGSSPFVLQKNILKKGLDFEFELRVEPFYKAEGEDIIVKLDLPTIMWGGKMMHNDKKKLGFFADIVEIRLTATWEKDDRSPKNFFPPSSNDSTQFGSTTQASVSATASMINPLATTSISQSRSLLSTVPNWITNWAGGHDGIATFTWRLSSWCPVSGGPGRALYKVEESEGEKRDWTKFTDVPQLPSAYRDGEFNGFDIPPPSAQWRVKGSTFRSNKMLWNVNINVRTSHFRVSHGIAKVGKIISAFRGLKWEACDLIIDSVQPISIASSRNALSQTIHEMQNLWIISLVLVVALVVWELGVRNHFL